MADYEVATLGGGCFWCIEAVFSETKGVVSAISGYMGGTSENPTYEAVCSGRSGHVEVVQVRFDPATITFRDILEIFFVIHDATTLDRQGNDIGTQYRSVIFYHSEQQKVTAGQVMAEVPRAVTAIEPAGIFWVAEAYHQNYFANNPHQGYCAFVVAPKVQKFRKTFAAMQRAAG